MIKAVGTQTGISPDTSPDIQKARLKEACQDFEAVLTGYLFQSMQESIWKAEEPSQARDIFEGMMHAALAREASQHEGLGLGKMLYEELLPLLQELEVDENPAPELKESSVSSDE